MLDDSFFKLIVQSWSFWVTPPCSGFTRQIDLPKQLHADLVLMIQGVRRCGKSTLLTQLPAHYKLPLTQCYFCNFEDPRLLNTLNYQLLEQMVTLARREFSPDI